MAILGFLSPNHHPGGHRTPQWGRQRTGNPLTRGRAGPGKEGTPRQACRDDFSGLTWFYQQTREPWRLLRRLQAGGAQTFWEPLEPRSQRALHCGAAPWDLHRPMAGAGRGTPRSHGGAPLESSHRRRDAGRRADACLRQLTASLPPAARGSAVGVRGEQPRRQRWRRQPERGLPPTRADGGVATGECPS